MTSDDQCERADSADPISAPNSRYQGLVVDFGGVLTTSFDGALRSYCVRDGLAPDALEKIFTLDQGAQGALVDLERGRISQAQFVSHVVAALGVDPDRLLERMLADLRWEPLVVSAAAQLRSRGIKVASSSTSTRTVEPSASSNRATSAMRLLPVKAYSLAAAYSMLSVVSPPERRHRRR